MADPIQNIGLNDFSEEIQYYINQYCVKGDRRYKCIEPTGHYGPWIENNWSMSSPRIIVSTTAPSSPNIDDLWVDLN